VSQLVETSKMGSKKWKTQELARLLWQNFPESRASACVLVVLMRCYG
jgi:hypothetical protein